MHTSYHLSPLWLSLIYAHTSTCQSKQQSVSLLPRTLRARLCASLQFTVVEVFVDLYIRPLEQQNIPKESSRWREIHMRAKICMQKIHAQRHSAYLDIIKRLHTEKNRQSDLRSPRPTIKVLWSHMHRSHILCIIAADRGGESMQCRQERQTQDRIREDREGRLWRTHIGWYNNCSTLNAISALGSIVDQLPLSFL